ncbi:MAG: hypothetical protein ACSLEM_04420 [Candidatus Malihini olakiniferum]
MLFSAANVVVKAIHPASKSDLAIEVAMTDAKPGNDAISLLISTLFSRVLWLERDWQTEAFCYNDIYIFQ